MSKNKRLNRDHAKKNQRPMVEDEVIAHQIEALLTPAITAQENYDRQLGLRDRILTTARTTLNRPSAVFTKLRSLSINCSSSSKL